MGKAIKSTRDDDVTEEKLSEGQPKSNGSGFPTPAEDAFMNPGPEDSSGAKDEQESEYVEKNGENGKGR